MDKQIGRRRLWASMLVFCFLGFPAALLAKDPPKTSQENVPLLTIPKVTKDQVICFALYTVHSKTLKLTAQLYPLDETDDRTVRLEVKRNDAWQEVAKAQVIERGWTATFRVEDWHTTRDTAYRVAHGTTAFYEGNIRKDPIDKDEIVVVAFTGNSIYPVTGGDLPKDDLVANVKRLKPDLLFFSGDQVYDHTRHLAYWLRFGRDFGDVIRNYPTVTLPDDHDVGQGNLWGAGGKKSNKPAGDDGGYFAPVAYVNEVQRAQTSHLPDPFDATPVDRGITVYYTDLTVGRINFGIIEDRKFKSGPAGLVPQLGPRPDHVQSKDFDPKTFDVPEAKLLGDRQLKFLRTWAADWEATDMKAVLSQTIFCGGVHVHGGVGRLEADLDANGWPQAGRNKALAEMRKAFAVHLAGDQHLGTVFQHGIDDWNDACYSFCVPSIANFYLRWWMPEKPGKNRNPGMPDYTGEHLDGLGNKVTCWAASNPSMDKPEGKNRLTLWAAGFGVVRFKKSTREITFDCWPRNVDVSDPVAKQYPGWPLTIKQADNYNRKAAGWLPTIEVTGESNPVIQIIDESTREAIYTLRIPGTKFRPRVFRKGKYTIHVGEGDHRRVLKGIESGGEADNRTLKVDL